MSEKQIAWAKSHDWFLYSTDGMVVVRDEMSWEEVKQFDDYFELRLWAGY